MRFPRLLAPFVLLAFVVFSLAHTQPGSRPQQYLTYEQFQERFWAIYQMSSGAPLASGLNGPANNWGMGWGVPIKGYSGFNTDYIEKDITRGVTHFILHQPYGEDRIDAMDFDARADAIGRGFSAPLGLGAVLRGLARRHPDVVFMIYLGAMDEVDLAGLRDEEKNIRYLQRIVKSLQDVLDLPNVHLAFDNMAVHGEGEVEWQMYEALKALIGPDRKAYIEAVPFAHRPEQWDENVVATEDFWDRSRPTDDILGNGFPDSMWAEPSQYLTGNIVRLDMHLGRGGDWAGHARHVMNDGPQYEMACTFFYYPGSLRDLYNAAYPAVADVND